YAWHHDGAELLDGDGDPQTWGVLSSQGGTTWVSHPALGRIDNVPGLDIVASSRDTKQLFVFNANGQVVAGWPRTLENTIRAGVVVGDINDDGINEIVAVDESGVVYVFRTNGTEFIDGDGNPATQGVFFRMLLPMTFNYSTPCLADMDNDGKDEIIVASQSSRLYVLNDNGTTSPGFPYTLGNPVAGSPAVGDVDNNGDLEIVIFEAIGSLRVINHDGTQQMSQFFSNGSPPNFFNPSPVIGNVQGDGKLEIFVPTKAGKVHGIQSNGVPLTGWPVTYSTTAIYTESSPAIADIDGNGTCDIVLGDESQYIRAWTPGGQVLAGFPLATGDAMRAVPTVTDLDQDGSVDLVAAGWDKTVHVWDFGGSWNPANAPWPRFHANVHNNGRLNYLVPTPVGGVSFSFARAARGLALQWIVPDAIGGELSLSRSETAGKEAGAFARVSPGLSISEDGLVRWVDAAVEEGTSYVYRLESSEGTVLHETGAVYVPVRTASLGQNYPNPFNPTTRIEYRLPEGAAGTKTRVSVVVYDVRGAKVRELVNGEQEPGKHAVDWDGRNDAGETVGSGVYFYRLRTPQFVDTRKMVLVK
ncbi:MAG TPA: FG-GAP-like repeat-containing protein, partial [Candidatus Krumholzibacteria bacterium]|nr:FG-GAP-like repeat-containing protein [Candidatus Krumholzibacteria bacterium]